MKSVFKYIKSNAFINLIVRSLFKQFFNFSNKFHNYLLTHFPVSGIITTELPCGEKLKLYSDSKDYIPTQVFWKGSTEIIESTISSDYHLKIIDLLNKNNYYNYLITPNALIRVEQIQYNPYSRNYLFSEKKSEYAYMSFNETENWINTL
ncbi:MAG: hypothetical protein M3Q58_16700 [Bacteroidota bacterium]|nr:hypothetical protein [Bacteroidota bacterium]